VPCSHGARIFPAVGVVRSDIEDEECEELASVLAHLVRGLRTAHHAIDEGIVANGKARQRAIIHDHVVE
jgi:hypothetical protein